MLNQRISLISGILLIIISSMMTYCASDKKEVSLKSPAKEVLSKQEQGIFPPIQEKYAHYTEISFDLLTGYDYEKTKKIPKKVKELNNKQVILEGFMLPTSVNQDYEYTRIKSFFLLEVIPDDHGLIHDIRLPAINDFVFVDMVEPCAYFLDVPIRIFGQLSVGKRYKNRELDSLYRLKGELVVPPRGIKPH